MRVVFLTTVLAVVLSVDAQEAGETQKDVCRNKTDGAFVADTNSCSKFIVCYNQEPVSQDCETGSYFDTKKLFCAPDTKNACTPTECNKDGAYSAHPTNCSLFYVCYSGKLVEQSCGEDSYFDKENLFCRPDVDRICWPISEPCTCVGNYTEGEMVKDPDSCHSYYLCSDGELVQQTCGYGNYFDNDTKRCERDNTGECWTSAQCTGGLVEGDRVPSSKNCSVYLECQQGELIQQYCKYGYLFDNSTKKCEQDVGQSCWKDKACVCDDGSLDGDLVANNDSCYELFVCSQGKLIPQSCGKGNYFDKETKSCVRDDKGICWPRPCAGGLEEGDRVPSSNNCSLYLECKNGDLVQQNCQYGYLFDDSTKKCELDVDHTCWKEQPCVCDDGSEEGDLVANNNSCYGYFVCTQGQLIPQSCGKGYYFDKKTKKCLRDDKGICWPRLCAGGLEEGDRVPSSGNCSLYLECKKGDLVQQNCQYGYLFDNSTKKCELDVDHTCWKEEPCVCDDGSEEGDLVPNKDSCHEFFVCTQGKLVPQSCGKGNYFDKETLNCVRDDNGICWPRLCAGGLEEGDRVPSSKNCSLYLECKKGDLVQQNCQYGYLFDNSTKKCEPDVDHTCWKEEPCVCDDGSEEGDLVGNNNSCHGYFVCTQGQLIPQSCGKGYYFDKKTKKCLRDDKGICWPRLCTGGLEEGDRVPSSKNCSLYLECKKGDLVQQNCQYGYLFDNSTKKCELDVDHTCWKEEPCVCDDGSEEGDLVPNKDSCHGFFVCTQGKLIPQSCGKGNYFDKETLNCVRDDQGVCWPRPCAGGLEEGDRVPSSKNCSLYLECKKGDLVQQNCQYGYLFDNSTKKCELDVDHTCWKEEPCVCDDGSEEGDLVPNKDSCHGFFVCTQGKLIPQSCGKGNYFDKETLNCVRDDKGVCWPRPCAGGLEEGDRVPSSKNCSLYLECKKGDLVQQNCQYGYLFDNSTKKCELDVDHTCWKEEPCVCEDGSEEGDLVPNKDSCHGFFVCTQGKLIPQSCGKGNYFDKETLNCVRDDKGVCWPRPCAGGLEEGDRVPSSKNCSLYLECNKGDLVQQNCQYGYLFDNSTKKCELDVDHTCWKEEPCVCDDGSEEGDLVPNKDSCHGFFVCTQGKLIPQSCGKGNYFDKETLNCIRDDKGICWPRPCPGGLEEGDRVPSSKNCSLYLECKKGDLVQQNCQYGYLFDNSTKKCELDVDHVCWKEEPCVCDDGSKEGDLVANNNSCYEYFVCTQGQLIPQSCGKGYYFDKKTKKCMRDDKGICWPRSCAGGLEEGDRVPSSKNCSLYLECKKGDLVQQNCQYGYLFDNSTKRCVKDVYGICWQKPTPSTSTEAPCECPGGYEDGEFVPHNSTCYMFYICYGGKLIEESCGYGNYFDAEVGSCVLDINGLCWNKGSSSSSTKSTTTPSTTTPSTTTSSTTTPSTTTPSTTTSSTTTPSTTTPSTTTPSTTTPSTTTPSTTTPSTTTIEAPCECPGGYEDGEFVPHNSTCYMFYICYDGKLIEESCGYGNYFDAKTGSCVLDINGLCWNKGSSSSSTKSTTTPSTTTPSTTTQRTCPGGYEDGELVSNPKKCYSYFECSKGYLIERSCGFGKYFDIKTKTCVVDKTGVCWPSSPSSSSSTSTTSTTSTTTEAPCTCPGGYEDGQFVPHPSKCYLFYMCYNGKLIEQSCGYGNYFDALSESCIFDINGICWSKTSSSSTKSTSTTSSTTKSTTTSTTPPPKCPGGIQDGAVVPHPNSCYKFYICYNGRLEEESCGKGSYFDASTKSCVLDTNGICWPLKPTPSTSSSTSTKSTTTPSTTTRSTTTSTTTPSTTSSTTAEPCECPDGHKDGDLVPHPSKCYKFYICYNGELIEESCGRGNYFDTVTKSCVLDTNGICWPLKPTPSTSSSTSTSTKSTTTPSTTTRSSTTSTTTPSTTSSTTAEPCECPDGHKDGDLVPHPSKCYKFYICYNGELIEESCGRGNYFDTATNSCVLDTNGICWPLKPTPSTPTTSSSTSTSTKSTTTPSTTTRSSTTSTTTPSTTSSTTAEPCECPDGHKDGDLVPHPSKCYKFYICYNGELIEESCGRGNYFDTATKSCVLDTNGICWPLKPTPSTPTTSSSTSTSTKSTTTPSTTTRSSTTSTTTPSTTSSTTTEPCECDGGHKDGELVPHPTKCYKFYICYNGELIEESCGRGNYFDHATKSCVRDTSGFCWSIPTPSSTSTSTKSTTTPSTTTRSTTTPSTTSSTTTSTTTPSTTSSTTTSTTTPSTTSSTTTEPCECDGGHKDGELVPHPTKCYKFYICYNGELIEESCGRGNYFDLATKSCVRDTSGFCWPIPTSSSTSTSTTPSTTTRSTKSSTTPSTTTTSPTTTTSTTTGSTTSPSTTTPSTTTQSSSSEVSTSTTTQSSTTPCTCPGGFEEGEFIPHPTLCYKFLICFQGKLSEMSCGTGNYFNEYTKSCTLDTIGICWPKHNSSSSTTTDSPKPEPCLCPDGIKEGQFIPDSEYCYKYSICYNGVLVGGNCGTGNYFNNETKVCQPDTTGVCWPLGPTTTPPAPCECPDGIKEGQLIPDPTYCYKYSVCSNGVLVEGHCGTGNYFNNDTKSCERDTYGCCWPCKNGEMIPNIEECDKFSICNDGQFVEQQCGTGYYFDVYDKYCVRDVNGTCWKVQQPTNTCQGAKDGTLLPDPAACEKYFVCQNNKPVSQECGMGNLFNSTILKCVHDTCGECWTKIPNVCANKPTGTFVPNTDNCDQFYVCHENHAILQQCGSGNWFDPEELACVQDLNAKCINVCRNTKGITQLPHPHCNQFYLCSDGNTKAIRTCNKGTNYDAVMGICLASATCEENLCSTAPNGVIFPVKNDPSNFYSCYNKKPVKLSCPDGTSFDSERLICIPDTGLCIGQTNGFTIASKKNSNAYYVCKDNAAIFEQCPAHTVFDENKRICVHALRKRLVNNICSTEADGTMISGNSCNKYHLCLDGESIEQNCGAYSSFNSKLNSCVLNSTCFNPKEICAKSSAIEKLPDARYETSYITCKRGEAILEKCPKNTIYSHDIGSCVSSQMAIKKKELSEICNRVPDKTITPALDCRKFYICNNRVANLQQCAIDQLFNLTTGTCQADVERQCWMRSETLRKSNFLRMVELKDDYKIVCQEGRKRHHHFDNVRFEVCKNRTWSIEFCPENNYFDLKMEECSVENRSDLSQNQRSTWCSSEYTSHVRRSGKLCNEYYRCEDNQWKLHTCPMGKYFNTKLATCTYDNSSCGATKGTQFTGKSSCISNEIKANEKDFKLYHVCVEGIWWNRYCEEGKYFNETLGSCANDEGSHPISSNLDHTCENGKIRKMDSCSAYYLCLNGIWFAKKCPNDHYFNETLKACMHNDDGLCRDDIKMKCVENDRRFNPNNCSAFEICLFGEWLSVQCATGLYFDISLKECLVNHGECSANYLLRRNCAKNIIQPSLNNCSEFYQCSKNEWRRESCLKNFYFNSTLNECIALNKTCDVRSKWINQECKDLQSVSYFSDTTDCTKFHFCENGHLVEGVCSKGKFFDNQSQRCQLDNGSCVVEMVTHDNICQNKSRESFHRNPANCTTFYSCINMTALLNSCPPGQYFNADLGSCQTDIHGKCVKNVCKHINGGRFPHETYCSLYYTCMRGKLIPIACDENHFFDPLLSKCIPDIDRRCINGLFKDFNSVEETTATTSIKSSPISCVGKQGDLMPDPENCNKFYVCINENLRHDKCIDGEFFDISKSICTTKFDNHKCQNTTETTMKCSSNDIEINYADYTDCRKYFQCNDAAELISKKCRNGESFDNLLGFCRQSDGTCLIENGQRVGACAGKHGKLVADDENCLGYFTCINGQKIGRTCKPGDYFDKKTSQCEKDFKRTCLALEDELDSDELSCKGLDELVFYPNTLDGCKTFFQCVNSIPRKHICPDDYLYDSKNGICDWKENVKCSR